MDKAIKPLVVAAWRARKSAARAPGGRSFGAAVRDATGKVWLAANVESDLRHFALCAERVALFYAVTNGASEITQIAIAFKPEPGSGRPPCGLCLEAFQEFATKAQIIISGSPETAQVYSVKDLLPHAYGRPHHR